MTDPSSRRDDGYGNCPKCTGTFKLTKAGLMRHHLGDVYDGRWRQTCSGVGQPPKAEAKPKTPVYPDPVDPSSPYPEVPAEVVARAREAYEASVYYDKGCFGDFDAAVVIAFAAGRAQAAADIRDYVRQWDATRYTGSYSKGLHDAARLAEGDPSKDPEPEVDHV